MKSILANGVMGLALPGLSHTGKVVLEHFWASGISSFSLFLKGSQTGSYLVLGSPDESWYDKDHLVWTPAVTDRWWAFEAVLFIQEELTAAVFLLDSGTSYIGVPLKWFLAIITLVLDYEDRKKCQLAPSGGTSVLLCPCEVVSNAHPLEIRVSGASFKLAPYQLFMEAYVGYGPPQCLLQVMPLQDGMPFILGDTFLRTVAAVFDSGDSNFPRIGLAPLKATWPSQATWHSMEKGLFMVLLFLAGLAAATLCNRCWSRAASGREVAKAETYRELPAES